MLCTVALQDSFLERNESPVTPAEREAFATSADKAAADKRRKDAAAAMLFAFTHPTDAPTPFTHLVHRMHVHVAGSG